MAWKDPIKMVEINSKLNDMMLAVLNNEIEKANEIKMEILNMFDEEIELQDN